MTTESQQYKQSDEISLKELIRKTQEWWRYLLSKWVVILIFGLLGCILGFTYAYAKKPIYTASTTFVLEDEKGGGMGNLAGLASMAGVDLGGGGGGIFQGDNILELYKSRTMIEKTLLTAVNYHDKKQLLIDRYIDFNKLRESWAKKPELARLQFSADDQRKTNNEQRLRDSVMEVIVNNINENYLKVAKPDKKLSIIKADVKSEDEFFAKAFNDQIVKNVNDFYVQTKTKKSLDNIAILKEKTDSVRRVVNGAIYTAVAVADATPNLNPTRQVQRVAPAQRAQFSAETNKAILAELVKNLEMSKMSLLRETPLIQVVDQPIYPLTKEKLGKVKSMIIGGILLGILACLFLILRRIVKQILS